MANRKAALIRCQESPWVATSDLREPHAEVTAPVGTVLEARYRGAPEATHELHGAGKHPLRPSAWTQIAVKHGEHTKVLVTIVSRG